MDNNKIDQIAIDIAEIKIMLKMTTVSIKKHDTAIYGNGKDGLLTRASLIEDEIAGIPKVKSRTAIMWWALSILSSSTVLGFAIYVIRKI